MPSDKIDILVYAHWEDMRSPKLLGVLSAHQAKGRKAFSFEYDSKWLKSQKPHLLDPEIGWYEGVQFPSNKENFGIFSDSMPDRWGRTLMKRRAILQAKEDGSNPSKLYELDFLLGVQDESRMGAIRFKLDESGSFLNDDLTFPIPPISSIRSLQSAATAIESDVNDEALSKWLAVLLAPGSSLGGARPKANVYDELGHLWIAKFPSKNDNSDKGVWEFLIYQLAIQAGIEMSVSKLQKVSGKYHTFLTKRFDRFQHGRIHFASAMTMTGNTEHSLKNHTVSYLELAEFIQFSGNNVKKDLRQLWRRIVFNIAVSNTDDHLRNHGFLFKENGWQLSPAYDLNPSVEKDGLSLNIDMESNVLDFELAKSVGEYFQLTHREMNAILKEVKESVKTWRNLAKQLKISRQEYEMMSLAFRY